jgi:hypothetical protein
MIQIDKSKTNPGMHRQFELHRFGKEEHAILKKLAHEWYLTNSGSHIKLAASEYDYFLIKPTATFSEMFNIDREIIAVFSSYPRFEPRTLDVFAAAQESLPELRTESVCRVLISKDQNVESIIESLLKTDPEQPIVIPFTYDELSGSYNDFFIRNRFRKHFYTRDLFSFFSPLRRDLYFFGRSELIQDIVNRHRSGEHTGLFGLRKSGKTSIIYAIERSLYSRGEQFISLDCESPSVHLLRWNELLGKIVTQYKQSKESKHRILKPGRYEEKTAADSFEEDMLAISKANKETQIMILFDEIERISPRTASSPHWRDGHDFVYFWQTLRSFYQRHPHILTYMIVGTNPNCVETTIIGSQENPLFGSIPGQYVPPFSVDQVRDMVRKLGRYMGMKFDELIYGKLTEDFGGHPFLIRQVCSHLHKSCKGERPARIDKALYDRVKKEFMQTASEYLEMILQVLQDWYPEEYDMLRMLAQGDAEIFGQFAADNQRYTKHLVGYGLINESPNGYSFAIDAVKEFLLRKHKYERINLTKEEQETEISARRNSLERRLRTLIKNVLCTHYGSKKATEVALAAIPDERRKSLPNQIEVLLNRDKSGLYFIDLGNMVLKEWERFKNVFELEKDKMSVMFQEINLHRKADTHASTLSKDDFLQLRLHFSKMESILDKWEK